MSASVYTLPQIPTSARVPNEHQAAPVLAFKRPSLLRFWLKLVSLFVLLASFLFTLLWAGDAVIALAAQKTPKTPAQPAFEAFPRLSDDLERRLHDAFDPPLGWTAEGIGDPFIDRTDLAGQKTTVAPTPAPVPAATPVRSITVNAVKPAPAPTPAATETEADRQQAAAHALTARLNARERDFRAGQTVAPLASFYLWTQAYPLGLVGDRYRREVLFYSPLTKQTFAGGEGASFFDATLEKITETGVTFRDAQGQIHTAGWSRINLKTTPETNANALSAPPLAVPQAVR